MGSLEFQDEDFTVKLPGDWLQGRTAYGGLSAALCLEATLRTFPGLPPLRSAHFAFAGPAVGVLHISAKILRQGKSMVFTVAEIEGEMGIAVQASFCFGMTRSSKHHAHMPMPDVSLPDACPSFFTWRNRPNFLCHFKGRLAGGGMPFLADGNPEMLVWLRHDDQGSLNHGTVGLLALADVLPPAFFLRFNEPVPISTITWSMDFFDENPESPDGWWLGKSSLESAQHGFSTQKIAFWSSDGQPILAARQNIAVFEGV